MKEEDMNLLLGLQKAYQNLRHINVFLELWAQLFQENLGTSRLAIKLEGTQ